MQTYYQSRQWTLCLMKWNDNLFYIWCILSSLCLWSLEWVDYIWRQIIKIWRAKVYTYFIVKLGSRSWNSNIKIKMCIKPVTRPSVGNINPDCACWMAWHEIATTLFFRSETIRIACGMIPRGCWPQSKVRYFYLFTSYHLKDRHLKNFWNNQIDISRGTDKLWWSTILVYLAGSLH